jgi:hypothetical protein
VDFSKATTENTLINIGVDNLVELAAYFSGFYGAKICDKTSAYLKLINGEVNFLFGTQRDIFRLITRNVEFEVMPQTAFNDLYQNISVTNGCQNIALANKFIGYLLDKSDGIKGLGLFFCGKSFYDGELKKLENIDVEYKLNFPISKNTYYSIKNFIYQNDINSLKKLLN